MLALITLYCMPGEAVFYGAISPKNTNAGAASLFIIFVKVSVSLYYTIFISLIMNALNLDYGFDFSESCVSNTGLYKFQCEFQYFSQF